MDVFPPEKVTILRWLQIATVRIFVSETIFSIDLVTALQLQFDNMPILLELENNEI